MLRASREVHRRVAVDLVEPVATRSVGARGRSRRLGSSPRRRRPPRRRRARASASGVLRSALRLGVGLVELAYRAARRSLRLTRITLRVGDLEVLGSASRSASDRRLGVGLARRPARRSRGPTRSSAPRSRCGALAEREAVGQQRLVGGRPEVAAELAGDAAAQDRPQQLLDLGGDLGRTGARRRFPRARRSRARARARSPARRCCLASIAVLGVLRSARRRASAGPTPAGPSPSSRKRSASRWSLSASIGAAAVEAGLEAQQRAAQAPDPAGMDADGARQVAELGQVALGQAVAARARAPGAGRDPPPAVAGDANPAVRGRGRRRRACTGAAW